MPSQIWLNLKKLKIQLSNKYFELKTNFNNKFFESIIDRSQRLKYKYVNSLLKETANYCSAYPESADQIDSMIENEFIQTRQDKKRIYLFLIHQIFLVESQLKRQDNPFLKALLESQKNYQENFVQWMTQKIQKVLKQQQGDGKETQSFILHSYQTQDLYYSLNMINQNNNWKLLMLQIRLMHRPIKYYNVICKQYNRLNNHIKYINILNHQLILIVKLWSLIAVMINLMRRLPQIKIQMVRLKKEK